MPLYVYACECGYQAERLVEIKSRDTIKLNCPECGKRLRRVPTVASLGQPKHETKLIMGDGRKVSGTWERGIK